MHKQFEVTVISLKWWMVLFSAITLAWPVQMNCYTNMRVMYYVSTLRDEVHDFAGFYMVFTDSSEY